MADNSRPVAEPLQKGAQAAQAVRGAVKTGKAIAGAAKGAAAGGVWGAVADFAWENRKFVGKVIIAATAVLMIPILILCMLPGIIFGGFGNSHSPADPDTPIMNSSAVIDSNLTEISTAVSRVLSEALTDTLSAIDNDYAACTADGKEIMLNKNVAVYGASGSMKTRAYCINRILQATVPGKDGKMESLIICDPKSELYEKTSELLRKTHTVKVFNLVCPENSDSWNCLAEIEGDELMAQRFCDVIIKNTGSERGDHFWDSAEMNLLKALVLYVEQGYPPERKNIGQVYRLLTHCDEKELNSLFNMLPSSHPAKAPYAIFQQASDTVRSGVIIGLGSRLQVFQNRSICNMTAFDEIDMELPGQQPCAYFCITSDQDSTFDFLSSLFLSFVFIKLVRYADKNCEGGKLPIPVHVLGEELTACGVIPDLSRKISVIRSRNISMSCVFQNLAGLQNRYPLNQWQEILGNSDVQLFLGCVDELTAKYISDRSGEVSVHVQSKAKQLGTWRISNYTPEYRETSGVGKRKLLTMDEVLRLPISKALIIIRGRKLLQVDKCDYTKHPESKKMISCKASAHIPEWQKKQPKEVEEVSPAPVKKPGRKKRAPTSNVVPTDKDSIMSKN